LVKLIPSRKKIAIVSPSFQVGGIERTVSLLANHFSLLGYDVLFLSLLDGRRYISLAEQVTVVVPSFKRTTNIFNRLFYRVKIVKYIRTEIRKGKPDVVLSMSDTFNPVVLLATYRLNTKVFVGDVTKPDRHFHWSTLLGKKILYPTTEGFIAQTRAAAEYYKKKFRGALNMTVINGMIKPVTLYPAIEREPLIINVGRLSFEKGQDRLIEIFYKLKNRYGWKLGLTASGPLQPLLEKMVQEKGLQGEVIFLGHVENLDELYARASIFAMPSRMEGFPNALCEAMAAGLPCVSFDSFPVDEIISHNKDGLIIRDGDLDEFAQQLDQLIVDKTLRVNIGIEAMKIKKRLDINSIGKQFIDFMFQN
jgi:GalNAc-alpha-(1->4)-GalNAc-alpha-(1->3)-diNAcBac-PP-undecaprenol alpha-1,4-N-acetyl-D-galactosaminyltransferase